MASGVPDGVTRLVARHIKSVDKLELLLLLRDQPERGWTPDAASGALRSEPRLAAQRLEELVRGGFAQRSGEEFRYAPESDGLDRDVGELADCYARRRHTIISLIYSAPSDAIQSFSDAFRLRRG